MYPAIMQTISAERDRAMREQAAAWRRAREARSVIQARPARIPFALIARFARNARSLPRQKRLQGSEAVLPAIFGVNLPAAMSRFSLSHRPGASAMTLSEESILTLG